MLDINHPTNKSFKPLIIGFALSVLLTTAAYLFAQKHLFNRLGAHFNGHRIWMPTSHYSAVFFLSLGSRIQTAMEYDALFIYCSRYVYHYCRNTVDHA